MSQEHNCEKELLEKVNSEVTKQRLSDEDVDKFRGQENELERVLFNPTFFNATLVDEGANEFQSLIAKSKNPEKLFRKEIEIRNITKQADGSLELDGLLAIAGRVDAHGDLFLEEDLKIARDRFMSEGRTSLVDIQHDGVFGKAFINELYIVKEKDSIFGSEHQGSLAARIKVVDEGVKQKVLRNELNGFSIFGEAESQVVDVDEGLLKKGFEYIIKRLGLSKNSIDTNQNEGLTMSEIKEILDKLSEVEKSLQDQISELQKSQEVVEDVVEETKSEIEAEADEKAEVEKQKDQDTDDKFERLEKSINEQHEMVENLVEAVKNLEKLKTIDTDNGQDNGQSSIRPRFMSVNTQGE